MIDDIISRNISLLARRDVTGRSSRDVLMIDALTSGKSWSEAVWFVDQTVVAAIKEQQTSVLQQLALDGYDYINIDEQTANDENDDHTMAKRKKLRSMVEMAADQRLSESFQFLSRLPTLQASICFRPIAS